MRTIVNTVNLFNGNKNSLGTFRLTLPSKDGLSRRVGHSLHQLLRWIENAPEVTVDPSDIKAHPFFQRHLAMRDRILANMTLKAAYGFAAMFPHLTRRFLQIPTRQTPGAVAWLAQGYLELFRLTKAENYLRTAELWLSRLDTMRIPGFKDYCWGLPFDWQSRVRIPANAPLLYTSWQAGQAYLDHFELTNDAGSLRVALSTCRCLLSHLHKTVDQANHLALSYSPYDSMEVYNTNSLAGGLFCKVGILVNEADLVRCGRRMLNWVASGQRTDGAWEYYSPAARAREPAIDHYHTAMTLQGLLDGLSSLGEDAWLENFGRGLAYYLSELFDPRGRPKMTPAATFPVDIMSAAEGLILLSELNNSNIHLNYAIQRRAAERHEKLLNWTCRHFQSKQGAFYYRLYPGFRLRLFSFRWGQGAMLKALASCLVN
jgi:hypothetical protein